MQEWPPEFEELLSQVKLPTSDLDVGLKDFIRIVCALLGILFLPPIPAILFNRGRNDCGKDIPIHNNNLSEALHLIFSLYASFKENQAFNFDPSQD